MKEVYRRLCDIGYEGDSNLSNMIDWIRNTYNFTIWIEHGISNKKVITHDLTTNFGSHRGNYAKYEMAQFAGILKFLFYYDNGSIDLKANIKSNLKKYTLFNQILDIIKIFLSIFILSLLVNFIVTTNFNINIIQNSIVCSIFSTLLILITFKK